VGGEEGDAGEIEGADIIARTMGQRCDLHAGWISTPTRLGKEAHECRTSETPPLSPPGPSKKRTLAPLCGIAAGRRWRFLRAAVTLERRARGG
jgi:hypothetical protein